MPTNLSRIFRHAVLFLASLLPGRLRAAIAHSSVGGLFKRGLSGTPNELKEQKIMAGPAKGLWIRTNLSNSRAYIVGTYEPENVREITSHCQPGMTVVDIGAHEGYMTLVMARSVGQTGRVLAFEPNPANFESLSASITRSGLSYVECFQIALSDHAAQGQLFELQDSSFMGRVVSGDQTSPAAKTISVPLTTLDEMLLQRGLIHVDFIKMDVEGHELAVLNGMRQVIESNRPNMLIEFHSDQLLQSGRAFLGAYGYQLREMHDRKMSFFCSCAGRER